MARHRTTQNMLVLRLGRSQSYWSRRLNAEEPFDLDDLAQVAALLDVPITRFFDVPPRATPGYRSNNGRYTSSRESIAA